MLMRKIFFFALAAVLSASAGAQQFKWKDKDGRLQYGDTPPPGVKATRLRPAAPPAAPAPSAASKGPLTPAEQEAEFRKRQAEAQKAGEKESQEAQNAQAKKENCQTAKQQLAALESGGRISRTDANGERYYLDDDQRQAEAARARKQVGDWCN